MATSQSRGQFVTWNGGCLLIGRHSPIVPMHSHYAIQIAFGREPGVAFRTRESEPWKRYGGAMIPSRQPHTMDASQMSTNAVMFVEPETRQGRVIDERYLGSGIAEMPESALECARGVFTAWDAQDNDALREASKGVIRALTGDMSPQSPSDPRVLKAIDYINAHLDEKLTLEDVAAQVFLSPSRFRHLFMEETGTALRPYILWRRFLKVWDLAMAGASMSEAAHAAGFADAAHLSRTSKRMFGFPPTVISMAR